MLTSSGKCSRKNEKSEKNWKTSFAKSLSLIFCCVSKNEAHQLKPRIVSSSVQCDILSNSSVPERVLNEDFKLSLNKLDSLIDTLQDIKEKYQENDKVLALGSENTISLVEKQNLPENEEITKFNVNINEKTCIECITKRGKHSLAIFDNKSNGASNEHENVRISKECDSEMVIMDSASEKTLKNVIQLQKSHHTLSNNFGRFSSVISRHISNLRKDVNYLRTIMYNFEYKFGGKMTMNQLSLTEVNRKEISLVQSEESKFMQAKLRASTFCRFYNMRHNQNIGKKRKRK